MTGNFFCSICSGHMTNDRASGRAVRCPHCGGHTIAPGPFDSSAKDIATLELLYQQLKHKDPSVRLEATVRLGEIADPAATKPLIHVLTQDPYYEATHEWRSGADYMEETSREWPIREV